ncbi:MAG: ABC transporter substrate-binding protein [Desulfococcaceae bacterium]
MNKIISHLTRPRRRKGIAGSIFRWIFPPPVFPIAFALVILAAGSAFAENVVVDQAGRRISTEKPFTRIITLYAAHTENLFAMGLDEQIVGVPRNTDWPPEAGDRPIFSYHDDPERFMAVRPDLVLVRPMIDRVYAQFVQKLEQAGITAASLQPVGMADMFDYWRDLGKLVGREAAAEEMIREFQAGLAEIRACLSGIPEAERKRVYFEAIHSKMKTFAPAATQIFVLEAAGGINAAPDSLQMRRTNIAAYGKERILARGEEIDVFIAQQGAMNPIRRKDILSEPGFQAIRAVREGEVYVVDERIVSRPGPRLLEGIRAIAEILYPETMAECETKTEGSPE